MAGPVTRKASPTQVYELLQKLDGYTDNVSGNLYNIKRAVNELLGMRLNIAQKEQLDKVEYRVYRSLSQADVARYFADARPVDLSKAYNKDGTFKDVGEALSTFEKLAKDPRSNVYTLRRLLNELGLEKNRMDAKRRAQYERCHEAVERGVKTQAERHFVFESYRPTLPRAAPKESVPVKVEAGKLKTMDETLKALGIILKNPGLYLQELKKIHKEWDLKAQANAKRTEYDRLMLEIDRKLSIRDQLEIYPVEKAGKPAAKPDLLRMRQQPEPERAMLGEDTSYAGRPRPSLMGRDLFMPVKMTDVPKAPLAPKDWYNYMGATNEAEAKQRADGFAQSLYNSVYARLMGDNGWKAREGATLQDYLKGNEAKGIAPIPASYLRVLFRGANKETTDKIISELSAGDALGAYATALRNGVGDSPFANFMWNDLKNTLEKMRVLVPMVAFVNEAEMTVLETKRVAMSVYAFVDLVTSGVFAPRLNKNDVDQTLTLSLDYTGAAQRVVPGAGAMFGLKPRKRPREGEMFYVEARVEGRPGGEDVFQGAVGTFVLGYKDESGRTRSPKALGGAPLYYAVATEATTEGEVRVKGAFGFGIGRDSKGMPMAIILGLRGVARESAVTPPLTRLSGDVKLNMALPPMKGAGFGRRILHPDQLTLSVGGGGLGETAFAYPKWLLGPGIKAEWDLGKRMRLDLGLDAKFGKLNIPDDVAFNSPMGKFYMLWMLSGKLEF